MLDIRCSAGSIGMGNPAVRQISISIVILRPSTKRAKMKNSDKMLTMLQDLRDRRKGSQTAPSISESALNTIHAERNKSKATCYWLGFLRGLISSDGVDADELEPLILHTEEFLTHFADEDAEELLTEICNEWPSISDEAEGIIENILEFREGDLELNSGYNAANYFYGFMKGIACDNKISEAEALYALNFLEMHPGLLKDPRVTSIRDQLLTSMSDGTISPNESEELCSWISRLVGDSFADTGLSSAFDLAASEDFAKYIDISSLINQSVAVTGVFSGPYSRRELVAKLEQIGVKIVNSVSKKVLVLIVANEASKHWATPNAGTKLITAHTLRRKHGKPTLVTENVALNALHEFESLNSIKTSD